MLLAALVLAIALLFTELYLHLWSPHKQVDMHQIEKFVLDEYIPRARESNNTILIKAHADIFTYQAIPYKEILLSTNNAAFIGSELTIPKPKDEYRVILVGGSQFECLNVEANNNLQSQLTKICGEKKFKFYVASQIAPSTSDLIAMFFHKVIHCQPDFVILSCLGHHRKNLKQYWHIPIIPKKTANILDHFKWFLSDFQVYNLIRNISHYLKYKSWKTKKGNLTVIDFHPRKIAKEERKEKNIDFIYPPEHDTVFLNFLKSAIGASQQLGFKIAPFLIHDAYEDERVHFRQITDVGMSRHNIAKLNKRFNDLIIRQCISSNTPFFDARNKFEANQDFVDSIHFSEAGIKKCAVLLFDFITKQQL